MAQAINQARGRYRKMHRYSSARRDRFLSLYMLAAGGMIMGVLFYLILTK